MLILDDFLWAKLNTVDLEQTGVRIWFEIADSPIIYVPEQSAGVRLKYST